MERKKVRLGLFLLAILLCVWAMHRVAEEALERLEARGKESIFGCLQAMLQRSAEETMAPTLSLRGIEPMEWLGKDLLSFLAPVMTMDLDVPFQDENCEKKPARTSEKISADEQAGAWSDVLVDTQIKGNPIWEAELENAAYAGQSLLGPEGSGQVDLGQTGLDQSLSGQRDSAKEELGQSLSGRTEGNQEDLNQEEPNQDEQNQGELNQGELGQGELDSIEYPSADFLPEKARILSEESMNTYAELVKNFYVIDSTTMADASLLNAERFMAKDMRIDKAVEGPQILIYHTHSQEAFADSEPGNAGQTVVGVGDELTKILSERYGYQVLHHTGIYDLPSRNGAYSKALPEVENILSENPSIQVVIDLHRDEMPEKVHLVTKIDGKQTARFMFFNGISRTRKTGELEYLFNPYLEDNLALSFQLEKAAQEYYPNLTRKIYLKGYRYNMHICPKTLLIELGAQNNTFEEAINACEPLASLLDYVLSGRNQAANTAQP